MCVLERNINGVVASHLMNSMVMNIDDRLPLMCGLFYLPLLLSWSSYGERQWCVTFVESLCVMYLQKSRSLLFEDEVATSSLLFISC